MTDLMKVERTDKVLKRVSDYLRLMRFKYTDLEKLSRLNILEDYYNTQKNSADIEKLSIAIESAEQLSSTSLTMPLKVRGVFLTEGRPKAKYYTAEELRKSTENPINQSFPMMLDHKDREAGKVIGMVDNITYNETIRGIKWWGHINDETFARNVLDGAIKEVSATIYSSSKYTDDKGLVALDLTYKELSLVMAGAEPNNFIQVDDDT